MPEASAQASSRLPRWTMAICAGLLLVSGILSYQAALNESPTFDEPLHATAGYLIRWMGDYRVDVEDPALFTLLSSLPQSRDNLHIDPSDPRLELLLHNHDQQWQIVIQSMFRTLRPDGQSVYSGIGYINRARLVFVAIDVALGALIAWWAFRLAGPVAAMIATGFFAFDPNFLGHGALVKNDVAIALLMLWMMYAIWRFGQRAKILSFLSIAISCGLALNIKFSGVIFPALLTIALFIRGIRSDPWQIGRRELRLRRSRIGFAIAVCAGVCAINVAMIWAVYGFRFSLAPDPSVRFDREPFVREAKLRVARTSMSPGQLASYPTPLSAQVILWADDHRLLPDAWLYGLLCTWETSLYRGAYLLGRQSMTGWWYYFPLAMLFKTPVAVLAAAVVVVGGWFTKSREGKAPAEPKREAPWRLGGRLALPMRSWDSICLWLPIIVYGLVAIRTNLNLGLRHVFPLYPFIYIHIATSLTRPRRSLLWIASILITLTAVESLASWPHEIPFFNLACDGPRTRLHLLSDSNLDWGQDLPMLAKWQEQHRDRRLYLAYFGSVDPHGYGIDYTNIAGGYPFSDLPAEPMNLPGVFAISATFLQGTYNANELRDQRAFVKNQEPIVILGGSLYLYDWNPAEFDAFCKRSRNP